MANRLPALLIILSFIAARILASEQDATKKSDDYRLPRDVYPTEYDILLRTKMEEDDFQFTGRAKILVTMKPSTKFIVFHRGNLSLTRLAVMENPTNKVVNVGNMSCQNTSETCKIDLSKSFNDTTELKLEFDYEGVLRDDMIGFYRSSYFSNGSVNWLAATQFQNTHARHTFPCFDEPSFKAHFRITIERPTKYLSISNMPLQKSEKLKNEEMYADVFERSVMMPTYLVAFVICRFESIGTKDYKVWARGDAIAQAKYALNIGTKALQRLSELFGERYELPKMEMIAIPDFSAGAAENYGLITYRETRMLYDEEEDSVVAQQNVASVVVHEVTHMWFGNLLTPFWWGYLWLSEGFARYFQYFATAQIETQWKMDEQFLVEQHQAALLVDSVETSKAMTREVTTPSEIAQMGDFITYAKGASVIRMMSHAVGVQNFYAVLQDYIKNGKKTGVVEPQNLWTSLDKKLPVKNTIEPWTTQPGYPSLIVYIDNWQKNVVLKQKRFLHRNLNNEAGDDIWPIPITYTKEKEANFSWTRPIYWLTERNDSIPLERGDSDGWIIFNIDYTGFYRVNYEVTMWYKIFKSLKSENYESIPPLTRSGLVDDLLNLARAEQLYYDVTFDGLSYLKRETHYLPFKSAFKGLSYLTQRFAAYESDYALYREFALSLVRNVYELIGFKDRQKDDRLTRLLRRELNDFACKLGHEKCIGAYVGYFRDWRNGGSKIAANQRGTAYCMGIMYGNSSDWNYLWERYLRSNSVNEQATILGALGCSKDKEILQRYMNYAVTPFNTSKIRAQDSTTVFSAIYGASLIGAEAVLDFIDVHHSKMVEYYGNYNTIASILTTVSQSISGERLSEKFERIAKKKEFAVIERSLKRALDLKEFEYNWYSRNAPHIVSWLKRNQMLEAESGEAYRLPTNVLPKRYVLFLEPHISPTMNFTFDGRVQIIATVANQTNEIVLHSVDIEHHSVKVFVNTEELKIALTYSLKKYDFFVIRLEKQLPSKTEIIVEIRYTGELNREMRGFYRSSYVADDGQTRWLAATHLEPTGARKMLPCFDEPALKAVFSLGVKTPPGYNAISNTEVERVDNMTDGGRQYRFKDTPRMSTYLLALIVSDFESVADSSSTRRLSVWFRPNAVDQANFALSRMKPSIDFFETNVKMTYQLSKLDMVALPDFTSGAMENWGLLTYKEKNLLYRENESSIVSKQAIANVITHEIAHQWFGNLVSPLWWKYLWLNEGFARFFQYFGTAKVEPDWELESQFVVEQLQTAFESDALPTTHPMTHDVFSPAEISAIFDTISYAKSASVLRMFLKTLGPDVFYSALHDYLDAKQYDAAQPSDLYNAIAGQIKDAGLKKDIHEILDTWTTQAGYPILNITIRQGRARLSQQRFLLKNRENETNNTDKQIWHVPITWATSYEPNFNDTSARFWLKSENSEISLMPYNLDWVIFNVQQAGYYRVNYDHLHWERLINILNSDNYRHIAELNRAMLIDDLMNLGRAGYVDYGLVLSATEYLSKEDGYLPWRAFFNALSYLHKRFEGQEIFAVFKEHVATILSPLIVRLHDNIYWDISEATHTQRLLRIYAREWACKYDIGHCTVQSLMVIEAIMQGKMDPVPADSRSAVYCTAIKYDIGVWSYFWKKYLNATLAYDQGVILNALACSTNTIHLDQLLTAAITEDSVIRYQDSTAVFSAVYSSSLIGAEFVMDFIKLRLDDMYNYYGGYASIKTIVSGLSKRLSSPKLYEKFGLLIEWLSKRVPESTKSWNSYMKSADYELSWYKRNLPTLKGWLTKKYPHKEEVQSRLPTNIRPLHYDLAISCEIETANKPFEGTVKIDVEIVVPTFRIILNSYKLTIDKISVYETANRLNSFNVLNYVLYPEVQQLYIHLDRVVDVKEASIEIRYSGMADTNLRGLYGETYKNYDYIATYFQPNYARMAFPCFDEPAFKATFKIQIERPITYRSLSNMNRESTLASRRKDYIWDVYKTSRYMSTYLVAFVVSKFEPIRNEYELYNVWGRKEIVSYAKQSQYFAQLAYKKLQTLLLNSAYLENKIDLVMLPNYAIGAMENWGLVMFREAALAYDKVPYSLKQSGLTTIAHELSHTWFGNLVTCDWWSYVWLNEGFAEYFQWIVYSKVSEDDKNLVSENRKFMDLFVVHELHRALEYDATSSSRPMNYAVSDVSELRMPFDEIGYQKGSSIIRMLHHVVGDRVFWHAIRRYLNNFRERTVIPQNLWDSFEVAANLYLTNKVNVTENIGPWADNPGYPVVTVNLGPAGMMNITQTRFSYESLPDIIYNVPITLATSQNPNFSNTTPQFWLKAENALLMTDLKETDWFVLNVQQAGYYRVNYDERNWQKLIDLLNSDSYTKIDVVNRAQIIDDLFNLARAEKVNYRKVFAAAYYLARETEYLPWKAFARGIDNLRLTFYAVNDSTLMEFVDLVTHDAYKRLGFVDREKESLQDKLTRELVLSLSCKSGNKKCQEEAFNYFMSRNFNEIPQDAKPAVLYVAAQTKSETLRKYLVNTTLQSDQLGIIDALGCEKDHDLLKSYLKDYVFTKKRTAIPRQYISRAFTAIYRCNKANWVVAAEFLMDNYLNIYEILGDWNSIKKLFLNIIELTPSPQMVQKLNVFIESNKPALAEIYGELEMAIFEVQRKLWYSTNQIKTINTILQNFIKEKLQPNAGARVEIGQTNVLIVALLSLFSILFAR